MSNVLLSPRHPPCILFSRLLVRLSSHQFVSVCGLLGLQLCVEGYGLLGTRCKPCASSKYLELTKAGIIVVIIVSIFASCVALGRAALGNIFSLCLGLIP